MTHSESIKELAAALAKAQGELAGAKKDVTNTFFKAKYADLASIVEALKACFPANGLSYVQTIRTGEVGVGVETLLMHSSGEWIKSDPFYLPVNKADAQGFGSCATYARRYSLAAISGVAPEDDDGNAAAKAAPLPRAIPANVEGQTAFDGLPEDAKQIVREHAMEIIACVKKGDVAAAVKVVDDNYPPQDHEGRLALWTQLPSDVRTKYKAETKRQQQPAYASQP